MDNSILTTQLKNFLDSEGRLKQYPSKHKPKTLSLFYFASKFEPGKRYTEKEVNECLRAWHTFEDWALLRRELFQSGFLDRELDGSQYWLREAQPTPADFGLTL